MSIIFLFCAIDVQAQNSNHFIDSLIEISKFTEVTSVKFNAYKNIYEHLRSTNLDSAMTYGQKAVDLANERNWLEGKFHMLRYMGDDCAKRQPALAEQMATEALLIAKSLNQDSLASEAYGLLGRCAYVTQDLAAAQTYTDSSVDLEKKVNNKIAQASNYNILGLIQYRKGNNPEALEYFEGYLSLVEALNDSTRTINALNLISVIYQRIGKEERSIEYAKRALELVDKTGKEAASVNLHNNLAISYYKLADYNSAIRHYNIAKNLMTKYGANPVSLAGVHINLANIYNDREEYLLALKEINHGLNLLKGRESHPFYSGGLLSKGAIHTQLGQPEKGIPILEEALKLSRQFNAAKAERNALQRLFEAHEKLGNYKSALAYQTEYIAARDSFNNKEDIEAITQTRLQFEFAKEKLADSLVFAQQQQMKDLQISEQQAQLTKQRNLRLALLIGMLLLGLQAFTMYRANRNKTKANLIIAQEKEEAEKQRQRAEQSEKFKERFLAHMSHEIRTPMHAISGMTNILKRNPHPTEQEPYLDAMQQSARNLIILLNDILDLSKIEAGKIDIQTQPFDLLKTIHHIHNLMIARATEKELYFNTEIDDRLPHFIIGDSNRLTQVLLNLVSNAIKFTEMGGVHLQLKNENEKLLISVCDTGIGIPKDKIDRMFGSFEQLGNNDGPQRGTGLGLNISKQLVELQGGRIWAESTLGVGSTFYVELPLIESKEGITAQSISEDQVKLWALALQGCKMLLVEDDAFNRLVVTDDLQYYINDVHIDLAQHGKEAVDQIKNRSYDLVLMDIDMPIMNGHDAAKMIRQHEREKGRKVSTPIVAMTASLLQSEIQLCYDSGMNDFIPKPYAIEQLISVLHRNYKSRTT